MVHGFEKVVIENHEIKVQKLCSNMVGGPGNDFFVQATHNKEEKFVDCTLNCRIIHQRQLSVAAVAVVDMLVNTYTPLPPWLFM